ncbi:hypothetical protein Tco_0025614 [Tanacetum coccineum]
MKALIFHKMDTKEISDRYVAACFVNGLKAYDGDIGLGMEENMISNEFAVKLCLDHEVRRGNKVVKKELIVALRGEIYFVNFIINPEEDDIKPGVVLGRSFMHLDVLSCCVPSQDEVSCSIDRGFQPERLAQVYGD